MSAVGSTTSSSAPPLVRPEPVGGGRSVVVRGAEVLNGAEVLDGAVGENDAREIRRQGVGEFLDPGGGIAGIVAAEERGGEDDGVFEDDGF